MKKFIFTKDAPAAIGPYSQGVDTGSMMFVSGQIPIDPGTGELVKGDVKQETLTCLKNMEAILLAGGYKKTDVVKATIFLTNLTCFGDVNEVYGSFFGDHKPARACFEVKGLPKGANVEIEAIASKG